MTAPRVLKIERREPDGLSGLHERACRYAEKRFAKKGGLEPIWVLALPGSTLFLETPFDDTRAKNIAAFFMRKTLRRVGASGYSFISEAWMAAIKADEPELVAFANEHGVAALPPDKREEVLMINSHDRDGAVMASRWLINSKGKKPFLGPRVDEEMAISSGRLWNLFAEA
jgi:hypothetical protein